MDSELTCRDFRDGLSGREMSAVAKPMVQLLTSCPLLTEPWVALWSTPQNKTLVGVCVYVCVCVYFLNCGKVHIKCITLSTLTVPFSSSVQYIRAAGQPVSTTLYILQNRNFGPYSPCSQILETTILLCYA